MWDKKFRIAVFLLLYEVVFNCVGSGEFNSKSKSIDFRSEVTSLSPVFKNLDLDTIFDQVKLFFQMRDNFEEKIKSSINTWDKTFPITKTCLYTFCLEAEDKNISEKDNSKTINSYLRLAQDYLGQENVSLVHAVILKL